MLQMRRGITMNIGACVGYRITPTNHRVSDSNSDTLTKHTNQDFFHGTNYQLILRRLTDGHGECTDLIEYMQDHNNLLQNDIRQRNTYSKKWRKKLQRRSQLSSYNTTNSAQIQTVNSAESFAKLIQTRYDATQEVIDAYKAEVDRMYPKGRLGFGHKHYRLDEMEELFKDAYSDRQKVFEKLQRSQNHEKDAQESVREAEAKCHNLGLNEATSKSELSKAHNRLERKKGKLQAIQRKIDTKKKDYDEAKETYRRRATRIYEQCRKLEEERLDQIRKTLIAFNQAIHSTEYSNQQNAMYEELVSEIESGQNTLTDLNSWAQTYHVIDTSRPSSMERSEHEQNSESGERIKSHNTALTTTNESTIPVIVQNAEEERQSLPDLPTTPQVSSKPKKKKNDATNPTTPIAV